MTTSTTPTYAHQVRTLLQYNKDDWFWVAHESGMNYLDYGGKNSTDLQHQRTFWNWWRIQFNQICQQYYADIQRYRVAGMTVTDFREIFDNYIFWQFDSNPNIVKSFQHLLQHLCQNKGSANMKKH
ncbi:MAG: hypothetical protein IPL33_14780 [Sphingobacteriales bacterium]|nr:hypothetical protein [Sphingobacteriales bacterium]